MSLSLFQNGLWNLASYISHLELLGTSANVLGFIWLLLLVSFAFFRLSKHFQNGFIPRPKDFRKYVWFAVPLLISLLWVIYMQMILDDGITTPVDLAYGSWSLMHRGSFTLLKLLAFKWDVYFDVAFFTVLFTIIGLWQFFHFTKKSAFWLTLAVILNLVVGAQTVGGQPVWNYVAITGSAHVWVFWLTYPEFRVITGFFCASLIKKPVPRLQDLPVSGPGKEGKVSILRRIWEALSNV